MIKSRDFINCLIHKDYVSFYGVPDSLLSSFSKSLFFDFEDINNFVTANEGSALGMGIGYSISTNKIPVIYLQNSGLGNIINPYTSLANEKVYNTPCLFIIGWRGHPHSKDEPQHQFQGAITSDMLEMLGISYLVLDADSNFEQIIDKAYEENLKKKSFAILVKDKTFEDDKRAFPEIDTELSREKALEHIIKIENKNNIYVTTTGKLSRELYSLRLNSNLSPSDFYLVGGMGHTFSIAFSVAHENQDKLVICLDGDGSMLMHLGSLGIISSKKIENFIHILFNNASHQSVGGQPTYIETIDVKQLSKSLGYKSYLKIKHPDDITKSIYDLPRPTFIEIEVNNDFNESLIRPTNTPEENVNNFQKLLKNDH